MATMKNAIQVTTDCKFHYVLREETMIFAKILAFRQTDALLVKMTSTFIYIYTHYFFLKLYT